MSKTKNYNQTLNSFFRSSKSTSFNDTACSKHDAKEFFKHNDFSELWFAKVVSGGNVTSPAESTTPMVGLDGLNAPKVVELNGKARFKVYISIVTKAIAGFTANNPDLHCGDPLNISISKRESERIIARGSLFAAYTENIETQVPQYGHTVLVRKIGDLYFIEQNNGGTMGMGFSASGVDLASLQWNISNLSDMPESCPLQKQSEFLNAVYSGQGYVGPENKRVKTWNYYNRDPNTNVPDPRHKQWLGEPWLRTPLLKEYRITSPYGGERCKKKKHTCRHGGVDFGTPVGTPCYSVAPGKVTHSGWQDPKNKKSGYPGGAGYGIRVTIKHEGGYKTIYAHLEKALVEVGDQVTRGQLIGLCGNTGNSQGPHLHWEMRLNNKKVDPLKFPCSITPQGDAASAIESRNESLSDKATKLWSSFKSKLSKKE